MKNNSAIALAVLTSLIAVLLLAGVAWSHALPGLPAIPGTHHAPNDSSLTGPLVPMAETPATTPAREAAAATPMASSASPLPEYLVPTYSALFVGTAAGGTDVAAYPSYLTAVDSQGDAVGYFVYPVDLAGEPAMEAPVSFAYIASLDLVIQLANGFFADGSPVPCEIPTGVGGYQLFTGLAGGSSEITLNLVGYDYNLSPATGAAQSQEAFAKEIYVEVNSSGQFKYNVFPSDFGTLAGGTFSAAMGLDDTGTYAVGYGDDAAGQIHAFIANSSGTTGPDDPDDFYLPGPLVDLGAFPSFYGLNGQQYFGSESAAYQAQINLAGPILVAGDATNGRDDILGNPVLNSFESILPATTPPDASSYQDYLADDFESLQLLPGSDNTVDSEAFATDSLGDLAGAYSTGTTDSSGNPQYNAYRVTSGGGFIPLGTLAAGDDSYAYGVNDTGYVAGEDVNKLGTVRGFLADPAGAMYALQGLVPRKSNLVPATNVDYVGGINAGGVIVGAAEYGGSQPEAVILTPNGNGGVFDVTSNVTIQEGALVYNHSGGVWDQDVTVSAPYLSYPQTYDLFITGLTPSTASFYNRTGIYADPVSSKSYAYISANATSNPVVFHLEFSAPSTAHIKYTPYVYEGAGP